MRAHLRAEGFTEIRYVETIAPEIPSAVGAGKVDFSMAYASQFRTGRNARFWRDGCPQPLLIARRRLQSAGDGLDDRDRGSRGALQIWKLPLLAMSLSISGRAALSLSSSQPLDAPFAGRMSSRCIMPISS